MEKTLRYFGFSSTLKEDHMREHGIEFTGGGKQCSMVGSSFLVSISRIGMRDCGHHTGRAGTEG